MKINSNSKIDDILIEFLRCIKCKGNLKVSKLCLKCINCIAKYETNGRVVKMMPSISKEMNALIEKWDKFYRRDTGSKEFLEYYNIFMNRFFKKTYSQLNRTGKISKKNVYLEIGSGNFFMGQNIATKCKLVIGIEICPSAIKIAKKMLDSKKIKNYILIQGDILNMPIKDNKIDLIYGGGVIEHFDDTQKCIDELYRVLKKGAVSFNTVPYLNLGSLTYRQIWGNIPNIPFLKQIAIFFHTKVLGGRHMKYGFEMSFLGSTLKRMHQRTGFRKVKIERFDVSIYFEFMPIFFKKPFIWLANNSRIFWPMVKVIATK